MEPRGRHVMVTRETGICVPLSSLFVYFALLLLILFDGDLALESKTSSLFLTFSYSASLQIAIVTKLILIVSLQRTFLPIQTKVADILVRKTMRYYQHQPRDNITAQIQCLDSNEFYPNPTGSFQRQILASGKLFFTVRAMFQQ